jgi:putative molybdopterin biosynthesis protein
MSSSERPDPRRYFLVDLPLDEASQRFFNALETSGALTGLPEESVPLVDAQGRVTSQPVWAKISSPHYDAAAMDGVAVRAAETSGASETAPVQLTLGTQAVWVDTGAPMPVGFDAVIMIEHLQRLDDATVQIMTPVAPWQHVRPLGEDIVATELVLPEGRVLTPIDLGAVAAAGLTQVPVKRKPRVAIIPTGNELVPLGDELKPGDIIEFNSIMLSGLIRNWGGDAQVLPPVIDDYELIKKITEEALQYHELVIINAGSSAGGEDFTASVVEGLGELLVHGVAVRPGHPVVLGLAEGKPIIGLPGYPVSAVLTAELFVKPLLERLLGSAIVLRRMKALATITRKVLSPLGEDEFLRVKLGRVGEKVVATPLQRGAGVITSLVRADGLALIPRFSEGLDAGTQVEVELLRPIEEVKNTIVAIGSHDLTLDLMSSHLRKRSGGVSLSSSHIGSLGGLIALRRGEAHLAGSHLLDEGTGEYNISYIRRYLPDLPVVVVNLVGRVQGLMVPPGNPKGVDSLKALVRPGVGFVNRQRGSGTRVLLDYKLKELSIDSNRVNGYQREEYSHLAVAAAVKGGSADAGLGILSASRALELDFIPLFEERYDLVIPQEYYHSALLAPLLSVLQEQAFREEVTNLGGYDVSHMGEVVAELG